MVADVGVCSSVADAAAGAAPAAACGGRRPGRGVGGAGRLQQLVGQHVDGVVAGGGRPLGAAVALEHQQQQLQLVVVAELGGARAPVQHGHRLRLGARRLGPATDRRRLGDGRVVKCMLWCATDTTLLDSKLNRLFFYLWQIYW